MAEGGNGGKISNVRNGQDSSAGGEGLEWIDALPLEDTEMSELLQVLGRGDGEDDASLGYLDEEFLGRSVGIEEVFRRRRNRTWRDDSYHLTNLIFRRDSSLWSGTSKG